jgi:hypothetical protein
VKVEPVPTSVVCRKPAMMSAGGMVAAQSGEAKATGARILAAGDHGAWRASGLVDLYAAPVEEPETVRSARYRRAAAAPIAMRPVPNISREAGIGVVAAAVATVRL